jgi:serine phosphatase RsbU (regulator of sigma subunit)
MERVEPTFAFKEKYAVNELQLLGQNDILLLYTDGLVDQKSGSRNFVDARLEDVFRDCKKASAKDILKTLILEVQSTHPPEDDLTLAVIKKL